MKNFIKNNIFGFIIGGLIFGSIGIYGSNVYESNSIEYSPTDASWEVSNVGDAINSLHSVVTELDDIKGLGNADASQILNGQTAVVKGSTITGTMIDNGAWTNTPTSSGKVTIPVGYHNGSGYVDTTSIYNAGYNAGKPSKTQTVSQTKSTSGYVDLAYALTFSEFSTITGVTSISFSGSTGLKILAMNISGNTVSFGCRSVLGGDVTGTIRVVATGY